MSLLPFYHSRFFDDPFFFNQFDFFDPFFFDPWYDFNIFPPLGPLTPQLRSYKQQERRTYSSTNMTKSANSLEQTSPVPQLDDFRVPLNVNGFNPDTMRNRIEGRKPIVEGKQEDHQEGRNYSMRKMMSKMRERYNFSKHTDSNGLTSYATPNNTLGNEISLNNHQAERRLEQAKNNYQNLTQFGQYRDPLFNNTGSLDDSDFQPRIFDQGNNQKQLEVTVDMKKYQPEEIKVLVKNNELIVQGEHQHKDENSSERSFFYKSTTLPRGAQVEQLQSYLNNDGQLKIEGPVL